MSDAHPAEAVAALAMLDEQEWEQILPHLESGLRDIKEYRRTHGAIFHEAKDHVSGEGALTRYFEVTGFRETNVNAIWHHRLSGFGPQCRSCGKLLRTPRAKLCAECGASV